MKYFLGILFRSFLCQLSLAQDYTLLKGKVYTDTKDSVSLSVSEASLP